jgi:tetratricopeptide (TPR) repeat protein
MTKLKSVLVMVGALVLLAPTASYSDPTEEEPALWRIDPDYAEGKRLLEAKDWEAAIRALSSAALRDTRNADLQNYLGFAYRKSGQLEAAFRHYEKALALNSRHRGAHEYVGEAYLLVGNLAKAEEHLAALERICLLPCEELEDLKEEIGRYKDGKHHTGATALATPDPR